MSPILKGELLEFLREKIVTVDKCNSKLLTEFTVKEPRDSNANPVFLQEYIRKYAVNDQKTGNNCTYIVYDRILNCAIAYFSLKAGSVRLYDYKYGQNYTKLAPGIEVSMFAANENYNIYTNNRIRQTSGIGPGEYVYRKYMLPIIKEVSEKIGVNILYLFALPDDDLISYYNQRLGFYLPEVQENQIYKPYIPSFDDGCVFMYQILKEQSIK